MNRVVVCEYMGGAHIIVIKADVVAMADKLTQGTQKITPPLPYRYMIQQIPNGSKRLYAKRYKIIFSQKQPFAFLGKNNRQRRLYPALK